MHDLNLTPSHEFSQIFSLHEGQPLWDLRDSIKRNGLREKIVVLDNKILDGRRREIACLMAGVKPLYRDFGSHTSDGKDPLEFVIDKNLHRRHLGEGERIMAAARYAQAKAGRPKTLENKDGKPRQLAGFSQTTAKAAEKFEVSQRQVERGKEVLSHGTEALQDAVAKDEITVSDAARIVDEPAKIQNAAVRDVEKGAEQTVTAAAKCRKPSKNGRALFDQKAMTEAHGKLARLGDSCRKAHGDTKEHRDWRDRWEELFAAWKRWQLRISGK